MDFHPKWKSLINNEKNLFLDRKNQEKVKCDDLLMARVSPELPPTDCLKISFINLKKKKKIFFSLFSLLLDMPTYICVYIYIQGSACNSYALREENVFFTFFEPCDLE